jgi:hypothetical protein
MTGISAPHRFGISVVPERATTADPALLKGLAWAFLWKRTLEDGRYASVSDIARAEKIEWTYVGDILRLTLLAPDIAEAIVEGRQPADVTLPALMGALCITPCSRRSGPRSMTPWATIVTRFSNQQPPDKEGWNIWMVTSTGPVMAHPLNNPGINMDCSRRNFSGWPCDENVEKLRAAFLDADEAACPTALERLHRRSPKRRRIGPWVRPSS